MTELTIYSDGGARGNPGPAGAGAVVVDTESGKTIKEISEYLGETTNNQAEYLALIYALKFAKQLKPQKIVCFLDSELVVRQLSGQYKVKHPEMKKLYLKVIELIGTTPISFRHIPREKNKRADTLVNKAIDRRFN